MLPLVSFLKLSYTYYEKNNEHNFFFGHIVIVSKN